MPVRPEPRRYRCTACGWSKTVAPQSDVMLPGDRITTCPACRSVDLVKEKASAAGGLLAEVQDFLGRVRR